jgi:hypothetical protein
MIVRREPDPAILHPTIRSGRRSPPSIDRRQHAFETRVFRLQGDKML